MEEKGYLLQKSVVYSIRVIPMLLALAALLNTTLSYFDIASPILSYIGGVSILPLAFLYLASFAFRFCAYHRMFLHYVTTNWLLNIYDYYIGIPVSNKGLLMIYVIVICLFMFLILYYHQKCRNRGEITGWIK